MTSYFSFLLAALTITEGSRDLGSPAGSLPVGTLDGLRPRVDQTGALLGRDFLQTSSPQCQPAGRSAGASARVPDRGDDQGLGPYYGPDLRRQPNSAMHVSLSLTNKVGG
jgi:hypothetical protein